MKSSVCSAISSSSHTENYEDRVLRITKRELLRRHRALPVLVESLLIAREADSSLTKTKEILSMGFILDLCRFSQKMKWLCNWGPEIIDEINRAPSTEPGEFIEQKSRDIAIQERWNEESLPNDQVLALLQDTTQNWDRIILEAYDPRYFPYLHLHPCEEIRLDFEKEKLSQEDIQNIAKCQNLRVLDLGINKFPFRSVQALRHLPDFNILNIDQFSHPMATIRTLKRFPRLTTLAIHDAEDFSPEELPQILSFINDRRASARELFILFTRGGSDVYRAFAKCTQVRSIYLDEMDTMEDNNVHVLFSSPLIQQSVRHVRMGVNAGPRAFCLLAKFSNIRWLDICNTEITSAEVSAIVRANVHHLCTLVIFRCYSVDDAILEAIARCRSLHFVGLEETSVSPRAVEAYKASQRSNWQAIAYKERTYLGEESEEYSDSDMEYQIDGY